MIFFDIDTQHDFMDADGALAVPDADAIKPNLERLLRGASEYGLLTISSRCAHEPGDAEFEIFPPHCLEGTRGAERIFADLPALPRHEFEADAQADDTMQLNAGEHYVVKKKAYDLFHQRLARSLARARRIRQPRVRRLWRSHRLLRPRRRVGFGASRRTSLAR